MVNYKDVLKVTDTKKKDSAVKKECQVQWQGVKPRISSTRRRVVENSIRGILLSKKKKDR